MTWSNHAGNPVTSSLSQAFLGVFAPNIVSTDRWDHRWVVYFSFCLLALLSYRCTHFHSLLT